jgi:hypothetical protein
MTRRTALTAHFPNVKRSAMVSFAARDPNRSISCRSTGSNLLSVPIFLPFFEHEPVDSRKLVAELQPDIEFYDGRIECRVCKTIGLSLPSMPM